MMHPKNNHIIVEVDPDQKVELEIGGRMMFSAKRYSDNWRDKSPIVAQVLQGGTFQGETISPGTWLICHHSYFGEDSAFYMWNNQYSVPVDEMIYAVIEEDGSLSPIMGNILVERVYNNTFVEQHDEYRKPVYNRGIVAKTGCGYEKGQEILWLDMADVGILYHWKGKEMKVVKVEKQEIVGVVRNNNTKT